MRIITRYVLREFLLFFTLALVCISSILILRQIFLLTKRFVSRDVSLWYLFELVFYALPAVLALTIPMAVLAGMLMVLGQFSFTGEITAMRASGFGIHWLTLPIMLVGCFFALTDYWMWDVALPWGNSRYVDLYFDISRQSPAFILEDGVVMRNMEEDERLWFYERMNPSTKRLENVRIWEGYKDGHPRLTTAQEASLEVLNGESILTLYDGISYEPGNRPEDVLRVHFPKQFIKLHISGQFGQQNVQYRPYRAMNSLSLRQEIANLRTEAASANEVTQRGLNLALRRASVELHKKFSIPFACLAFALASVPLGVLTRRSGFMVGMAIGLPLIILYYTLLRIGETVGEKGLISPLLGVWLPNVPIVLLGMVMTIRMLRQ